MYASYLRCHNIGCSDILSLGTLVKRLSRNVTSHGQVVRRMKMLSLVVVSLVLEREAFCVGMRRRAELMYVLVVVRFSESMARRTKDLEPFRERKREDGSVHVPYSTFVM